ncbi:MAG: DUF4105 domain-containing protein [Prevotella sp.]|nr:DUF4105 domain-containing protein [Prevotella sp.]
MDSVEISLLTCGPGSEVWSLYGHTAIRYKDLRNGRDLAINYGVFSFTQKYFIPRFVFGITDYEIGICPIDVFWAEYQYTGRWVLQQDLNLTREEKAEITQAIAENYLPENRTYRYNFFYDNCTTRARDMIISYLSGDIHYADSQQIHTTYREMTHQWTRENRWTRFGNDLLLGVKSDFQTDFQARQFLPDSLRKDFDRAFITDKSGNKRKLVKASFMLIEPSHQDEGAHPQMFLHQLSQPISFWGVVFVVILLVTLAFITKKRIAWLLDAMLLLLSGIAGLVLFAMIFSQHPTVNINFQILLLNPLSILFLYPAIQAERRGRPHWYWKVLFSCAILFLIGGFWQSYAEGMYFVALSLLVRCAVNICQLEKRKVAEMERQATSENRKKHSERK